MRQRRLMRYVAVASIPIVTLIGVLSGLVGAASPTTATLPTFWTDSVIYCATTI